METTKDQTGVKSPPKSQANVIRQLGGLERLQASYHALGYHTTQLVACRYIIPPTLSDHSELLKTVELAVARTVVEHASLCVGLAGERSRKPAWVELDSLDLSHHLKWKILDDPAGDYERFFRDELGRQLDTRFPAMDTRPGWRIAALRHTEAGPFVDLIFDWAHAYSDGMGAKIFQDSLLQNLNAILPSTSLEKSKTDSPIQLEGHILKLSPKSTRQYFPPPIASLCKFSFTPDFMARTLWTELKPPFFAKASELSASTWAPLQQFPLTTQHRVFFVPYAELQNILVACRRNKTTLTGLLHGILLASLACRLRDEEARGFSSVTAMDMRRFLPAEPERWPWFVPHRAISNYVSVVGHKFQPTAVAEMRRRLRKHASSSKSTDGSISADQRTHMSKESVPNEAVLLELEDCVWSAATQVRADIQGALDRGLKNSVLGLCPLVHDWRTYCKDMMKKPRGTTFVVTNLGVIDGSPPLSPPLADANEYTDKRCNAEETKPVGDETAAATTVEDGTCEFGSRVGTKTWEIERSTFSCSAEVFSEVFCIGAVAVKGKELCITLSWQDCIVDVEFGDAVKSDLETWLHYLGRNHI